MYAWQFAKAQHIAEKNGWTKFVSMQNHYNVSGVATLPALPMIDAALLLV